MARKAIVDRNTVLQLLKEGKTSQSIANQFGVSRQAIDLYRKEFVRTGLLQSSSAPLSITPSPPISTTGKQVTSCNVHHATSDTTAGCFFRPDD